MVRNEHPITFGLIGVAAGKKATVGFEDVVDVHHLPFKNQGLGRLYTNLYIPSWNLCGRTSKPKQDSRDKEKSWGRISAALEAMFDSGPMPSLGWIS